MKGLHTIWCQVSDMSRSVSFYKDTLGLNLEFSSPYWSQFSVGNSKIGLHPKLEGATPPLGIYAKGWYLGLETEDIRSLRHTLEEANVTIHGDYHDVPGGVVLDFVDPDGNTLEVFQAGITAESLRA
jgi:predicted enzyme related to lactoylglutathione lyase